MNTIKVHSFGTTGEAYDACQCDENIKNGDVLLIAPECVVGLAWTWPFAISKRRGHLHTLKDPLTTENMQGLATDLGIEYRDLVDRVMVALALADHADITAEEQQVPAFVYNESEMFPFGGTKD